MKGKNVMMASVKTNDTKLFVWRDADGSFLIKPNRPPEEVTDFASFRGEFRETVQAIENYIRANHAIESSDSLSETRACSV